MNTTEQNINEAACKAVCGDLVRLNEQQAFDLRVLQLWVHAKETGHAAEDIRAFTFRDTYLTDTEKKENQTASRLRRPPTFCDKNWHNALRLHSGDVVTMPGIARPIPPEWMPSSVKRVVK